MEEEIVVYLHGADQMGGSVLYRIDLETASSVGKGNRTPIVSPVAELPIRFGFCGDWTVIGDDVYWVGTWSYDNISKVIVSNELLKHNIHHSDPTHWETVIALNIPRASPVLAAVGTRKLAIIAGTAYRSYFDFDDFDSEEEEEDNHTAVVVDNWKNCGEIYDLDHRSLDYLTPDIQRFESYSLYTPVAAEHQEPTLVVFFDLHEGSMLILNASTGIAHDHSDPSFALLAGYLPLPQSSSAHPLSQSSSAHPLSQSSSTHPPPLGLEDEVCVRRLGLYDEDYQSIVPLYYAVTNSRAVFHKRTFYWLTYGLKLYAYDIDGRRWLRSECLEPKLHPLRAMAAREKPHTTLLLGLPNGKLLAIVRQKPGEFSLASLCVRKDVANLTLDVKVEHVQYFHPSDPRFTPRAGKARWLKNTGSGTVHG